MLSKFPTKRFKQRNDKKAQIVVLDLFMGLFIFGLILITFVVTWNRYVIIASEEDTFMELEVVAFQLTDVFIKTPGYPWYWEKGNITDVTKFGLVSADRQISKAKLDKLLNTPYEQVVRNMGVDIYDFNFQLRWLNNTNITALYGKNGTKNAQVSANRYVVYENETAEFLFRLWK